MIGGDLICKKTINLHFSGKTFSEGKMTTKTTYIGANLRWSEFPLTRSTRILLILYDLRRSVIQKDPKLTFFQSTPRILLIIKTIFSLFIIPLISSIIISRFTPTDDILIDPLLRYLSITYFILFVDI